MPLDLATAASLAAVISAFVDTVTLGRSFVEAFESRRSAPDASQRGRALQAALSTFDDREIAAIKARIESCRDRFIAEGSGAARRDCICSVLRDVEAGNNGLSAFPDWGAAYGQLGCA